MNILISHSEKNVDENATFGMSINENASVLTCGEHGIYVEGAGGLFYS